MRLRSFIHLTYHITCLMVLGVAPYHCDDCGLSHVKSLRFSCSGSHFRRFPTCPLPPLRRLSISTVSPHFCRLSTFPFPSHRSISTSAVRCVFNSTFLPSPVPFCFSFTPTFRHISNSTHFYLHFPLFPFAIVSAIRRRLPRYTCVAVFSL